MFGSQPLVGWLAGSFNLLVGLLLVRPAAGEPFDLHEPLICEASVLLGGASGAAQENIGLVIGEQRSVHQVLLEQVARIDLNRDGQLHHRELKLLDHAQRRELLQELDSDLDRKLSPQELAKLEQPIRNRPSQVSDPYSSAPREQSPKRESFQNLRRFGLGITRTKPATKKQPIAQAATFGSTGKFYRAAPRSNVGRSSGANRKTYYWRVNTPAPVAVGGCR